MERRNWVGGLVLITLGILFFVNNFVEIKIEYIWPLILVGIGVFLLFYKREKTEE